MILKIKRSWLWIAILWRHWLRIRRQRRQMLWRMIVKEVKRAARLWTGGNVFWRRLRDREMRHILLTRSQLIRVNSASSQIKCYKSRGNSTKKLHRWALNLPWLNPASMQVSAIRPRRRNPTRQSSTDWWVFRFRCHLIATSSKNSRINSRIQTEIDIRCIMEFHLPQLQLLKMVVVLRRAKLST